MIILRHGILASTGEKILLLEFQTEASTNTFDPAFTVSSGILNWDLGDVSTSVNANDFIHNYSLVGTKDVLVYEGTTEGATAITNINMDSDNLIGTLDISSLINLNNFNVYENPNLTEILNPISSQIFISYQGYNCNLTGTLDVSGLTGLGGTFKINSNTNLTQILNPTSSTIFTGYEIFGCDVSGVLDVSGLTGLGGGFQAYGNPNLTQILNPVSSEIFSSYRLYSCDVSGVLDVSGLSGLGGDFRANGNSNLTQILNPTSSEVFTYYYAYDCSLSGTLNLSELTGLGGNFRIQNNPNLTQILNPTSLESFTFYLCNRCDLTGTLDLSGLTGLGGDFSVFLNSNLIGINNPTSSTVFTGYQAYQCDLTGILDVSGLTGLGGDFRIHLNPSLTGITNPTSSTVFTSYQVYNCDLTGTLDISGLTGLGGAFYVEHNSNLTEIINPISSTVFTSYHTQDCNLTGTLDVSGLTELGGTFYTFSNSNLQNILLPDISYNFTNFLVYDCSISKTSVDDIFTKFDTWYTANTPTVSTIINTSGGTNSPPTDGSSNTNLVNIQTIFFDNSIGGTIDVSITINYPLITLNHILNVDSSRAFGIYADANFVYVADYIKGLYSYEFNGVDTLTEKDYIASNGYGVQKDGSLLYFCGSNSIYSYSVDGVGNLSELDASTMVVPMNSIADSSFLYVADHNGETIDTFLVDGAGIFTWKNSKDMSPNGVEDLAVGNGYLFALNDDSGVSSFSINGTTGELTQIDSKDEGSSSLRGHIFFYDNKIYATMNWAWFVYDVDGAGNLTQSYNSTPEQGHSVYVDSSYIYVGGAQKNQSNLRLMLFDINDPSILLLDASSGEGRNNIDEDIYVDPSGVIYCANAYDGVDVYTINYS